MAIVPDTKNWTWVLDRECPECGFDVNTIELSDMASAVRANAAQWPALLADQRAATRPDDATWSALEYGCHVRDVFALYDLRLGLMLDHDGAQFDDWDQDAAAVEQQYRSQNPPTVATELIAAAELCARRWGQVGDDDWQRAGHRSDGSSFTVESFARYFMHDPIHHLADVEAGYSRLPEE